MNIFYNFHIIQNQAQIYGFHFYYKVKYFCGIQIFFLYNLY